MLAQAVLIMAKDTLPCSLGFVAVVGQPRDEAGPSPDTVPSIQRTGTRLGASSTYYSYSRVRLEVEACMLICLP